MFHDPGNFAFTEALERDWRAIHAEYLAIRDGLTAWYETKLYGRGWDVFGLFDFPVGTPIEANTQRCPFTSSLVDRLIPRHGAVGFSTLRRGTRIRPHEGYAGQFLRCHLGLVVPAGDCALRVGDETRAWEPGKVLVFDDRVTHEAWNLTTGDRVILLIDFIPED